MSVATAVFEEFADRLPSDPAEQRQVLELGLRELRIRKALDAFRRGEGSLAFAARKAHIPLRLMIPLAYAHGLEPAVDPDLLDADALSLEQASEL
jgi:hypothetical protein